MLDVSHFSNEHALSAISNWWGVHTFIEGSLQVCRIALSLLQRRKKKLVIGVVLNEKDKPKL